MPDLENPSSTSNAQISDSNAVKEYLEFYSIYRDYVMHEGDLINSRLTWILTIHGFLYATYGLTIQKQMDVTANIYKVSLHYSPTPALCYTLAQAEIFLAIISGIGLFVSVLGWWSIKAAQRASISVDEIFGSKHNSIQSIKYLYDDTIKDDDFNKNRFWILRWFDFGAPKRVCVVSNKYIIPHIRGGGMSKHIKGGNFASSWIPIVLAMGWLISACVLYFAWQKNNLIFCSPF